MPEGAVGNGIVGELKDTLALERRRAEELHRSGAPGAQVSAALTALCDRIVTRAFEDGLERLSPPDRPRAAHEIALVAVGGYGRGDLAPFSDVDILFLHRARPAAVTLELASALVRRLWDAGLKLGHSVRTPEGAIAAARGDLTLRTALMEARLLAGDEGLLEKIGRRSVPAAEPVNRMIDELLCQRVREHEDYYVQTVSLLEPNVKKSPGGLRDAHLVRWVALARYGTSDPGALSREDKAAISAAVEFLSRLRNELHYHAGLAQDVLTRHEQVRAAAWLGFEPDGTSLGVERFMQHYYRLTTALHDVAMRFAEGARRRSFLGALAGRLSTRLLEGQFLLGRDQIALEGEARGPETLLRVFDLARRHDVDVAHGTLERIRAAGPAEGDVSPEARSAFLGLLADPRGLGKMMRQMHGIGLLERFIPAFGRARCLMQFNQYHKYTVDEHSIRALEAAVGRADDPGTIGQAYRETRRKDLLHLAILLHDLGKGLGGHHADVGRQLAEEMGVRFGLGDHDRQQLAFLVHQHLLMAHTAFRRDVADVKTLLRFVRTVGAPDTLRMLVVLTAADTEAVAPGNFTAWKESLLTELYDRAADELSGKAAPADGDETRAAAARVALRGELGAEFPADWLEGQLAAFSPSYLLRTEASQVAADLRSIRALVPGGVRVESSFLPEAGLAKVRVFLRDDLTSGIFYKIAGVLAATRFAVAGADIVTRADGVVVDTFWGTDRDFSGEPPGWRREEVARKIEDALLGRLAVESLFPSAAVPAGRGHFGPAQVEVDNTSSDGFTVLEVFADDRQGLLYRIARAIFEAGLSVSCAKISTRLDQAVDVFYVHERGGGKVTDAARLESIRRRLTEALA